MLLWIMLVSCPADGPTLCSGYRRYVPPSLPHGGASYPKAGRRTDGGTARYDYQSIGVTQIKDRLLHMGQMSRSTGERSFRIETPQTWQTSRETGDPDG